MIKSGAPIAKLISLPCRDEIVRMKTTYKNEDIEGMRSVESRMNLELDGVEKLYRKMESV